MDEESAAADDTLAQELSSKFEQSHINKAIQQEVKAIHNGHIQSTNRIVNYDIPEDGYLTGFWTQMYYVSGRTGLNIIRNPFTTILQVLIMVIFAVLVGLIYLQIDDSLVAGQQNRVGAFFFIVMNQVFGNLSAVELFIQERAIFIHENSNGFYRVSTYFLSKVFCDLIPLRIVPISVFAVITYFMIGLQAEVDKFFIYLLSLLLTTLTAAALGFLFSSLVRVFAIANLLIALIYVFMMVFGGFLVNIDSITPALRWIQYLSIFKYSLNTLYINEMKDLSLCTFVNGTKVCDPEAGNKFLQLMDVPYETSWDLWQNIVALAGMTIVLLILSYIALRRINKYK